MTREMQYEQALRDNDALELKVHTLEQQLASARETLQTEARIQAVLRNEARVYERAQVLAEVKALTKRQTQTVDGRPAMYILHEDLDALQPDPSLACLTVEAREQALERAHYSGLMNGDQGSNRSATAMAESRRLLQLPEVK